MKCWFRTEVLYPSFSSLSFFLNPGLFNPFDFHAFATSLPYFYNVISVVRMGMFLENVLLVAAKKFSVTFLEWPACFVNLIRKSF